jgi:hypothetical protein
MSETTVAVTTVVYGMGISTQATPTYIELPEQQIPARTLVAAHVRAEVDRATQRREGSLALHYLLAENPRRGAVKAATVSLDPEAEVARAWSGLAARRFLLTVDGQSVSDLDQPLALTARSRVCFVRLLPLAGG